MSVIRPEIKAWLSPDIDLSGGPVDHESFSVPIQLLVGPKGADGSESVEVLVVTPQWLQQQVIDRPMFAHGMLIVDRWDWPTIKERLEQAVMACSAPTWRQVGRKLMRVGRWEFEDDISEIV